jgi:hypothetical protein
MEQVVLPIVSLTITSTTLLADAYFLVRLCGCCCCNADGIFEDNAHTDQPTGKGNAKSSTVVKHNPAFDSGM